MCKVSTLKTISITALLLVTVVIFSGCVPKPPNGYVQSKDAPISGHNYWLYLQFTDLNPFATQSSREMYFRYENEIYYVIDEKYSLGEYVVYKDVEIVGNFVKAEDARYDAIFLNENFLYYCFRLVKYKIYYAFSPDGFKQTAIYYKYEFYRFNLDTGQNESININQFYDKLRIYYSDAILK